jgi:hypothetical protein
LVIKIFLIFFSRRHSKANLILKNSILQKKKLQMFWVNLKKLFLRKIIHKNLHACYFSASLKPLIIFLLAHNFFPRIFPFLIFAMQIAIILVDLIFPQLQISRIPSSYGQRKLSTIIAICQITHKMIFIAKSCLRKRGCERDIVCHSCFPSVTHLWKYGQLMPEKVPFYDRHLTPPSIWHWNCHLSEENFLKFARILIWESNHRPHPLAIITWAHMFVRSTREALLSISHASPQTQHFAD